jgi:hypothetical protein
VKWTDPLWLASQLYADPALREKGLLCGFESCEVEGMRQYVEMNTGEWWEKTEGGMFEGLPVDGTPGKVKAAPGAKLIPILLYADGTWLSANGNHTAKPFNMGIGNHALKAQHDLTSKKTICFCPDLGGSKATRNKAAFKRYKRKLQQDLIHEILGPVRKAQEAGGFYFESDGEMVLGFPVVCLFISDTPERQSTSLVFNSAKARYPCSMCDLPGACVCVCVLLVCGFLVTCMCTVQHSRGKFSERRAGTHQAPSHYQGNERQKARVPCVFERTNQAEGTLTYVACVCVCVCVWVCVCAWVCVCG